MDTDLMQTIFLSVFFFCLGLCIHETSERMRGGEKFHLGWCLFQIVFCLMAAGLVTQVVRGVALVF